MDFYGPPKVQLQLERRMFILAGLTPVLVYSEPDSFTLSKTPLLLLLC